MLLAHHIFAGMDKWITNNIYLLGWISGLHLGYCTGSLRLDMRMSNEVDKTWHFLHGHNLLQLSFPLSQGLLW